MRPSGFLQFVANFEELTAEEDGGIRQRDAYVRVNYVLEKLGIG